MEEALVTPLGQEQFESEKEQLTPAKIPELGIVLALRPFELSSLRMKAFACLIDQFLLIVPSLFFSAIVSMITFTSLANLNLNQDFMRSLVVASGVASFFSIHWLYFTLCESSTKAATVGMSLFGIKVQKQEGSKLSFFEANNRYWLWVFSSIMFGLNFLGYLGKEKSFLHDKLCQTEVVRES